MGYGAAKERAESTTAESTTAHGGGRVITVALKVGGRYFVPTLYFARAERHGPGPVNTWHCHDVYHAVYVVEGSGVFRLGERKAQARPGLLFLIGPGEWHQFFSLSEPFRYDAVTFDLASEDGEPCNLPFAEIFSRADRRWMESVLREGVLHVPESLRPSLRALFAAAMAASIRSEGAGAPTGSGGAAAVAAFLEGLGELVLRMAPGGEKALLPGKEKGVRRRLVDQAVEFMNASFSRPLTLEEIAGHVHLHPVYFAQLFKAEVGLPPRQYLLRIRINHARRLLAETDLPVSDIARSCGFRTVAYFSRAFRTAEGVSPSAYRRKHPLPRRVLA